VYITPGTSPGPDMIARIVTCAGGQVDILFPLDLKLDMSFLVNENGSFVF
jgi:hypothetical protein